jgi:hypothetical protein
MNYEPTNQLTTMFGSKKKKKGPPVVVRLFLTLIIMGILAVGFYQAYRTFSGVDPLKLSPESISRSLLNSESAYNFLHSLLSLNPQGSLDKAKDLLKGNSEAVTTSESSQSEPAVQEAKTQAPLAFKFAIVTDSHNDNGNLKKALTMSKQDGVKFVVGLGDWTDVGTVQELQDAKTQFETSGLVYYVIPGDHDLWDARDKHKNPADNFTQVFGKPYQSFSYDNMRVIMIYNSDDYLGIDGLEMKWIEDEVTTASSDGKLTLVFGSTPLFHPSSDHVMGRINEKLKNQADHLVSIFQAGGVKEVFSGDTHMWSEYVEPSSGLKMHTIGAVTSARNPQAPRFAIVEVYTDGTYQIVDTEIK